jgi:hypothetical protein
MMPKKPTPKEFELQMAIADLKACPNANLCEATLDLVKKGRMTCVPHLC